ncbi:hypothetical protein Nepgr_032291 [Nepenthes gracilis]|uniref:Uncharacterized protein n=1 Tax=Nepenthes gracilis TaxID=150966 RepID=A0AAD3Y5X6_NEPGR|nr:hypothetical protein Nepgr_032291 [Nepenthes gracilis]
MGNLVLPFLLIEEECKKSRPRCSHLLLGPLSLYTIACLIPESMLMEADPVVPFHLEGEVTTGVLLVLCSDVERSCVMLNTLWKFAADALLICEVRLVH